MRSGLVDPMCEVFPKQVACYYTRFGMGGGMDSRHAMCILGHNMINDKVFLLVWVWHCFMVVVGCLRVMTRAGQLLSANIRFFLIKMKMDRYFKNNAHMLHIRHYVRNCSLGDWFVLYQMSKNLNKRFFAEFLALLAMTVDPDPSIEPEEPEIHLSPEDIEKIKSATSSNDGSGSKKQSSESDSSDEDDDEGPKKTTFLSKIEGDIEAGGDDGGAAGSLTGKQRMLIKLGKKAKSANKASMMAAAAMKRARRK